MAGSRKGSISTAFAPRATETGERIRKSMDMDAAKLEEARRILGARTDTDAVNQALDYVIFQGEVFGALDALASLGGVDDLDDQAPPARRVAERRRGR
jgi:hypothetical protein